MSIGAFILWEKERILNIEQGILNVEVRTVSHTIAVFLCETPDLCVSVLKTITQSLSGYSIRLIFKHRDAEEQRSTEVYLLA